ncbi:MAG TPA: endonuclease/exonuclease/phosphatase family protein [Rubricoccaceae bacterium]|jgi:endonuclease/exonuclease/phosphatase family metal-dependent hydrolase
MIRTASVLRLVAVLVAILAGSAVQAQITVTPRGDAASLDIAAWNVEFYGEPSQGPNDAVQAERVQAVLERSGIDFWALEEVVSTSGFNALLAAIADDGYAGILGPNVSSDPVFNQRLAFIYRTSVVTPVGAPRTVVSSTNFGGRAPLELTANVTLGGVTRQVRFIAIHAKALSDLDSYNKRVAGAAQLKTYVDGLIAQGIPVVVMGDFNDELTTSIAGGRPSPYADFVSDADYTFATQRLNDQNIATYCSNASCSSGSTLDHIMIGGGAITGYVAGSGDRYGELLTGITQYTATTSDHLPVLARFSVAAVADEEEAAAGTVALSPAAPSPFRTGTTLRFTLAEASDVSIDVLDLLGRTVAHVGGAYGAGEHRVALDGTGLAAGVYRVRLRAGGAERVQTVIRAR